MDCVLATWHINAVVQLLRAGRGRNSRGQGKIGAFHHPSREREVNGGKGEKRDREKAFSVAYTLSQYSCRLLVLSPMTVASLRC